MEQTRALISVEASFLDQAGFTWGLAYWSMGAAMLAGSNICQKGAALTTMGVAILDHGGSHDAKFHYLPPAILGHGGSKISQSVGQGV